MEGLSIIIPVFNKLETTLKCIETIFEFNRDTAFEVVIIDNGSTDETRKVLSSNTLPFIPSRQGSGEKNAGADSQAIPSPLAGEGKGEGEFSKNITYIRNQENLGVSKAMNIGAAVARYDVLCFMHNDVFVYKENWTAAIHGFISKTADAGIVGLYGAKTLRKDGSFRGKTIVHAKKNKPAMSKPFEKVAVVDGLLLAMKKTVFDKCRGFCEGFPVHFYDKDMSLRAYKNGLVNYVLNVPFEHLCAVTRTQIPGEDAIRDEARDNFRQVWSIYLPVDVSSWKDRISYVVKKK